MNDTSVLEMPSEPAPAPALPSALDWFARVPARWILLAIMAVSFGATVFAMRRTSPTFDEIVLVAGGARGYNTGTFDLAPDHPPLMQYIYGLPVFLSGANYPDESAIDAATRARGGYRYWYAQQFYYNAGNDPERISFLGRLPAAVLALLLVLSTYFLIRRRFGEGAALLSAAMVAFLPDVLAHGGVAYNDLPLTLGFVVALFLLDDAIRSPTIRRALIAGVVTGLALGAKISAVALAPAALVLLGMEFATRRNDRAWLRNIAPAALLTIVGAYLALAAIFLGDFDLSAFRFGLEYRYKHFSGGHGTNAYLLGELSPTGWWYFFPVAFLFKTSAGLHLLMVLAAVGCALRLNEDRSGLLRSYLRAPLIGAVIFGAVLLRSNLNIGFRYALPVLPLICIATAVGATYFWTRATRVLRMIMVAAVFWLVAFPLSYYPFFLAYISEYGPDRGRNHEILIDSSLDWGQGLLELRRFMREHDIPNVYLSYFGSGSPGAYGIDYVPLQSFFALPQLPQKPGQTPPEWMVISASLLRGSYTNGDPFKELREVPPDAVIGHTMLVWHMRR